MLRLVFLCYYKYDFIDNPPQKSDPSGRTFEGGLKGKSKKSS